MLRETKDGDQYWLGVISKGRPNRVAEQTSLIGDATWYVYPQEGDEYKTQGAPAISLRREEHSGPGGGRNKAMDEAFARNLPTFILDDDFKVRGAVLLTMTKDLRGRVKYPRQFLDWDELATLMMRRAMASSFLLFHPSVSGQVMSYNGRRISHIGMPSGGLMLVKPNPLRQLTRDFLPRSEDYEYGIQHLRVYGGFEIHSDIKVDFDGASGDSKTQGGLTDTLTHYYGRLTREAIEEYCGDLIAGGAVSDDVRSWFKFRAVPKEWNKLLDKDKTHDEITLEGGGEPFHLRRLLHHYALQGDEKQSGVERLLRERVLTS